MRLILHIGEGKTGTSSLQYTLHAHSELLSEAGILYPRVSRHAFNHIPLLGLVKRERAASESTFRTLGATDVESMRHIGEECWTEIIEQVQASDAETCIVSNEDIFDLGYRRLAKLARRFESEFDEVHAIAYIRPPASRYPSITYQHVRKSSQITAPRDFRHRFRRQLSGQLQTFGEQLTVRPFARSRLVAGCIVRDFLSTVLPVHDELAHQMHVHNRNESMSAEAMCIMQELYHRPGLSVPQALRRAKRLLREIDQRSPRTQPRLRPGIAAKITEQHADDLEWLHEHLGVRFELPEEPWTGYEDPHGWSSEWLIDILDVDPTEVDRLRSEFQRVLAAA